MKVRSSAGADSYAAAHNERWENAEKTLRKRWTVIQLSAEFKK